METYLGSAHGKGNGLSSSNYLAGRGSYLEVSGLINIRILNHSASFLISPGTVYASVCTASEFSPLEVIRLK